MIRVLIIAINLMFPALAFACNDFQPPSDAGTPEQVEGSEGNVDSNGSSEEADTGGSSDNIVESITKILSTSK